MNKQEKIVIEDYTHAKECVWNGEYERAAKILEECMKQFLELGNSDMYIKSVSSLGIAFEEMGSRDMAMDCYLQGLKYVKAQGLNYYVGVYYQSIGNCFLTLEDYSQAIKYFKMGEQILLRDKQDTIAYERWIAVSYLNLGAAYLKIGDYDTAEEYLMKGLEKVKVINNKYYECTIIVELCRIRCKRGDMSFLEENIDYILGDIKTAEETPTDLLFTLKELVLLFEETKRYDDMYTVIHNFESIVDNIDLPLMRVNLCELYMSYYRAVGDGENYKKICVEHAEYCKVLNDKERQEKIRAINVKINLEEAKSSILSANLISGVDGLTGLKNRYSLNNDVKRLIAECEEKKESLLTMIIDLDCFKEYNDTYGHVKGDEVLISVSDLISSAIKDIGSGYRFGGDEFVIVVKAPVKNTADKIATELRSHLHHMNIRNEGSKVRGELTLSIGGYLALEPWKYSFDELLNKADDALYEVKENGRNDYRIKVQETE